MGLELLPAARALLSERGYDPVLGARPLRRTIQREIEDNLSEKILFGELRGRPDRHGRCGGHRAGSAAHVQGRARARRGARHAAGRDRQPGARRRDRRAPGQRRVASPGQRLSSPSRGVLRSLTSASASTTGYRPGPGGGSARRSTGARNPAMATVVRSSVVFQTILQGHGPARNRLQQVTGAGLKDRLTGVGYVLGWSVVCRLPGSWARRGFRFAADAAWRRRGPRVRVLEGNLRRVMGSPPGRRAAGPVEATIRSYARTGSRNSGFR